MGGPALHGNRFVRADQLSGQMGVPRSTETDLSVLTSGLGPGCPAKYFCNATSPAPSKKSKNATTITTINQSEDRKISIKIYRDVLDICTYKVRFI